MRIFAASAAVASLLLLPGLLVGPSLDAAVFTQVGSDVRHGATLYVGAWDHKPPGIYLLLAAGQFVLPALDPWPVTWVLSVAATAGAAVLLAGFARSLGASHLAATGAGLLLVVGVAQYFTALGGGLTEPFAIVPLAAAMFISARPRAPNASAVWFAVGVLLGASSLLSLQALPGAMAIAAFAALREGWQRAPGRVLLVVAGGLVLPALVAAWIASAGALPAAIDALVAYPAAYRSTNAELGGWLSGPVLAWLLLSLLFLVVPAAVGASWAVRQGGIARAWAWTALGWIVLTLVLMLIQGRLIAHYAIPLVVPLSTLVAYGLDRTVGRVRAPLSPSRRVVRMAPFIVAFLISALAGVAAGKMELEQVTADHERSEAVARVIQSHTGEEDSILVWGNEPQVYLDARRSVAGPYSYLYPLVTPGYSTPERIRQAVSDLQANPPAVVVDAGSPGRGEPGFQELLIPRPLVSDGRDLDILEPLREFIRAEYVEESVVDGWVVYVRRD